MKKTVLHNYLFLCLVAFASMSLCITCNREFKVFDKFRVNDTDEKACF